MNYALIEAGAVTNVIVWDGKASWAPPAGVQAVAVPADVPVCPGYTYKAGKFAAPPVPEHPPVVVMRVTARQARLALLAAGKLAAVNTAIDAMAAPAREQAKIEWEFATTVDRDSPLVHTLATALDLDLEALFTAAAKL